MCNVTPVQVFRGQRVGKDPLPCPQLRADAAAAPRFGTPACAPRPPPECPLLLQPPALRGHACAPGFAGTTTRAHGASGACQALTRARRACIVAVAAAAAAADGHPAHERSGLTPLQKAAAFRQAFWKFLRPHTIRGTILGSATVTARALIECPIVSNANLPSALQPGLVSKSF